MATIGENLKSNFSDMMTYVKIVLRKSEHGDNLGGLFVDLAEEEIENKIKTLTLENKLVILKYIERKTVDFSDKFRTDVDYEDVLNLESVEYMEKMIQNSILTDLIKLFKNSQHYKKKGKMKESKLEKIKIIKTMNILSNKAKDQMLYDYPKVMKKLNKLEKQNKQVINYIKTK